MNTQKQDIPQLYPPAAGDKVATIKTNYGDIKIKLFEEQVPGMTTNFIELAKEGKYNDVPFHRVVDEFMIQTGDFTNQDGTGGHSYKGEDTTMPDEVVPGLKHLYGTVSMAKSFLPDSAGSQFFIVTREAGVPGLDGEYSIFGQVYEGMDVAEKIDALQVPNTEKPGQEVKMLEVTVETFGQQ
ncbi:peptidylprolyl isomerase [Candidatus Peregrinibacteria bacterium]|nr:peptidylprolyl isomerase [Candidatus Peregrinibacteria bacterium]